MKPIINQVFIKPDETITEIKGLLIPESARKPNFIGTIVSTGKGAYKSPMKYKTGDKVLYESATPISEDLVVTSQQKIFGIFK